MGTQNTLSDFCKEQQKQKDKMMDVLEGNYQLLIETTNECCYEYLNHYCHRSESSGKDSRGREKRFTERAGLRTQYRKLSKYIRLIDFIFMDTLLSVAILSANCVLTALNRSIKCNSPLFQVEIMFSSGSSSLLENDPKIPDDQRLVFHPQYDTFKEKIESCILDGLQVMMSFNRLIKHSTFAPYVQSITDEIVSLSNELDMEAMIVESISFQNHMEDIIQCLYVAFQQLDVYSLSFAPFQQMYLENKQFKAMVVGVDGIARAIMDSYKDATAQELRDLFLKFKKQMQDVEQLKSFCDVGLIRIDCNNLNLLIKPSPKECLNILNQLVPQLVQSRNNEMLQEITEYNDKMSEFPDEIDQFMQLLELYRHVQSIRNQIDQKYQSIRDMYDIIFEFSLVINDEDKAHALLLSQAKTHLNLSMQMIEEHLEDDCQKFSSEINQIVPEILKQIRETHASFTNPKDNNPKDNNPNNSKDNMEWDFHHQALTELNVIEEILKQQGEKLLKYRNYQETLGIIPLLSTQDFERALKDLNDRKQYWSVIQDWSHFKEDMLVKPISQTKIDDALVVDQFMANAIDFQGIIPENSSVSLKLHQEVKDIQQALLLALNLGDTSLQPRHWESITATLGGNPLPQDLSFGELFQRNLVVHADQINEIVKESIQERIVEEKLLKVSSIWSNTFFHVIPYKETYNLASLKEIRVLLEDSLVTLQCLLDSAYSLVIRSQVEDWYKKLSEFQKTIEEWEICQKKWLKLETIFSILTIQKQVPLEAKLFFKVDVSFKDIMKKTYEKPNCLECHGSGLYDLWVTHNTSMETIRKHLGDYLTIKRTHFPRFYFLSDDELLQIVSHLKDPHFIQPYLKKIFENVIKLDFSNSSTNLEILGIISAEGEKVSFERHLKARRNVDEWISGVECNMRITLHNLMKLALVEYNPLFRLDWMKHTTVPSQCIQTVARILWTRQSEEALMNNTLRKWYELQRTQLNELSQLIHSSTLTTIQRSTLVALIIQDLHHRDISEKLLLHQDEMNSHPLGSFFWQQQLRFYWDTETDDLVVQQAINTQMKYGYEFIGASTSRLVVSPIVERCWMAITSSLNLHLGTCVIGTTGTGKTETSKDLARILGMQYHILKSSQQINYNTFSRFFLGIVQCGCWACLDDVNQMSHEILSFLAQHFLTLRQGTLLELTSINFQGKDIKILNYHLLLTMDPMNGRGGREMELPRSLKTFFRPIVMTRPDIGITTEVLLYCEGMEGCKSMGIKISQFYQLTTELLTTLPHCNDFGLRSVKNIVVIIKKLHQRHPEMDQDTLLYHAIREFSDSRMDGINVLLLDGILHDIFGSLYGSMKDTCSIEKNIQLTLQEANLHYVEEMATKILQLHDQLNQSFGVAILGPPGSGKTTCYRILAQTLGCTSPPSTLQINNSKYLNDNGMVQPNVVVLNPKSMPICELYGEYKEELNEWTDGLLTALLRQASSADGTEEQTWMIFDGPIDLGWMEIMNTFLDDNATLILTNGERIPRMQHLRFLFESQDLAMASPATSSRLGVIYVPSECNPWRSFAKSWLTHAIPLTCDNCIKERVWQLLDNHVEKGVKFVNSRNPNLLPTNELHTVGSLCHLFQQLLSTCKKMTDMETDDQSTLVDYCFVFSYVWSIGAYLDIQDYDTFDVFFRDCLKESTINLPSQRKLHDYFVDFETLGFRSWSDLLPSYAYKGTLSYCDLYVPTLESIRISFVLEHLVTSLKPTLLVGNSGIGKTMLIEDLLHQPTHDIHQLTHNIHQQTHGTQKRDSSTKRGLFQSTSFSFSAQTNDSIQSILVFEGEGIINHQKKNRKNALVIFIDDLHMARIDEYGAQPSIEVLRNAIEFKGFYDRPSLKWKSMYETGFVLAATMYSFQTNPRFMRHFNVINMSHPSNASMKHIFTSIVTGILMDLKLEMIQTVEFLTQATLDIYEKAKMTFLPNPNTPFHRFTLRDVSKVFHGIYIAKETSREGMIRLWAHEVTREFADRLNEQGQTEFYRFMREILHRYSTHSLSVPINYYLIFPQGYQEVQDLSSSTLDTYIHHHVEKYERKWNKKIDLVLYPNAVSHLLRIMRILKQPQGNALLVGSAGNGRRCLTLLASFILGYTCVQRINNTHEEYGLMEFRENLKKMMISTGVHYKSTVFLLMECEIVHHMEFLDYLYCIINSGQVRQLYTNEEYETILSDLHDFNKVERMGPDRKNKENLEENIRSNCAKQFVSRIRKYFHIVLCVSPGGKVVQYIQNNLPSFFNCTTIDCFEEWQERSLMDVATHILSKVDLPVGMKQPLCELTAFVHLSMKNAREKFYEEYHQRIPLNPKNFVEFVQLYIELLVNRRKSLEARYHRLKLGVNKWEIANSMVEQLQNIPVVAPSMVGFSNGNDENQLQNQQILSELQEVTKKKQRAEKLTLYLKEEYKKWKDIVLLQESKEQAIIGDTLLTAAYLSYCGPFHFEYRRNRVVEWLTVAAYKFIPCSVDYSFIKDAGTPMEIRKWQSNQPSLDEVSIENGILTTRGKRWPFLIDPHNQGYQWIVSVFPNIDILRCKKNHNLLLQHLKKCMHLGNPLLIDTLDENISLLLDIFFYQSNKEKVIQLNQSNGIHPINHTIERKDFPIFLLTKLACPQFSSDVVHKLNVVNFTLNPSGIENHLMEVIMQKECPEIVAKRKDLVLDIHKDQTQLESTEEEVLSLLYECQGDLLDDETLLRAVADCHETLKLRAKKMVENDIALREVNHPRNIYRGVAQRGTMIFLIVADLVRLDAMYHFSLEFYLKHFRQGLERFVPTSSIAAVPSEDSLVKHMTEFSYKTIAKGLLDSHQRIFAFLICTRILRDSGSISKEEWQLFLNGKVVQSSKNLSGEFLKEKNVIPNPTNGLDPTNSLNPKNGLDPTNGLDQRQWDLVIGLSENVLKDFHLHVTSNLTLWKQWAFSPNPFQEHLPSDYENRLTKFQKLLVLKIFREEMLLSVASELSILYLGDEFQSFFASWEELYLDLNNTTPCIFLFTPGCDLLDHLLQFAHKQQRKLHLLSLDSESSQVVVEQAKRQGGWVFFSNCDKSHWNEMESIWFSLNNDSTVIHANFRLFFSSISVPSFPIQLLGNSIKWKIQRLQGVKSILLNAYKNVVTEEFFNLEKGTTVEQEWKQQIFRLCLFHSMIRARKVNRRLCFWNRYYDDFSDSDLHLSLKFLKTLKTEEDPVGSMHSTLLYCGDSVYGGKLVDEWDKRHFHVLLDRYYADESILKCTITQGSQWNDVLYHVQSFSIPDHHFDEFNTNFTESNVFMNETKQLDLLFPQSNHHLEEDQDGIVHNEFSIESIGMDNDILLTTMMNIKTMIESFSDELDSFSATKTDTSINRMIGLRLVRCQEMLKYQNLLESISTCLYDILQAVQGHKKWSLSMYEIYTNLKVQHRVPSQWTLNDSTHQPIGSWLEDMKVRIAFMQDWEMHATIRSMEYPLSYFFFPRAFLHAVLQQYSRKYNVSVFNLKFSFKVLSSHASSDSVSSSITENESNAVSSSITQDKNNGFHSQDGVVISGLYLEGAQWSEDTQLLNKESPKELYSFMPPIHFLPQTDYISPGNTYTCPVYQFRNQKASFVVSVDLPTNQPTHYWILAGTAIICNRIN